MADERHFLGQWRQIRPDPAPAQIFITFDDGGHLTYSVETGDVTHFRRRWRLRGTTLITSSPEGADEIASRFRFRSPTMLVLEDERERYVYSRQGELPPTPVTS